MTKAESQNAVRAQERSSSATLNLWLLLGLGLLIRLLFIGNEGFKNDVSSFEAWAFALAQHPLSQFYGSVSFADYPPGYFYILCAVGHIFTAISPHHNFAVLRDLVKLPAILMDLFDGALLYAIARRFASERVALAVAAIFVLNPAVIFISAAWGQVDSISAGLALLGVYLLLRSADRAPLPMTIGAWVALSYSLLIKPQAAVLIPLFIAFAFADRERVRERLAACGAGILCAIAFAYALTVPFHPSGPLHAFAWLYGQYNYGKGVYPYNSVNAFNLWSIWHGFWSRDSQPMSLGSLNFGPQYLWGVILVAGAVLIGLARYVQLRTSAALLEAAALVTLAFFMLATRMHERYIYDGLLFTMAAIPFAKRYLWCALAFSATLLVNLFYSLTYLNVVTNAVPGVNAYDMWWPWTHVLSAINVALFFYLGYVFLGRTSEEAERYAFAAPAAEPQTQRAASPWAAKARAWFDPREGLASMLWPMDYVLAGLAGGVSFAVSYVNYWLPPTKIFDEIYFARAAEEYLTHRVIYENTHPPLTKLIITLSTMMWGGMAHGDNAFGWRFLDVVFGAIAVVIIYAFAKRLTRSTAFSCLAALLFIADGMHFVQSRIATPEGIVIVFSLGTLYAFYRFFIASQSTLRRFEPNTLLRVGISAGGGLLLGYASGVAAALLAPQPHSLASFVVSGLYFSFGWYLLLRLWVIPRFLGTSGTIAAYADGSTIVRSENGESILQTPDGGSIESSRKAPRAGTETRVNKGDLTAKLGEATLTYGRDGTLSYATPLANVTYAPGSVSSDAGEREEGVHATTWLIVFTLLLGALVASKWYGVMAYGVSFVVICAVWLQRYWRQGRAKVWGNPFGFRLDVAVCAIAFLSMTVYLCAWIPDFFRHLEIKNLSDLMTRQYSMFMYHDTLKATHPYQSVWWQWPLDLRPIAYYWKDLRSGALANVPTACCVSEIISLPNPLILWFGLICVPLVAYWGWCEKNKGYLLLILAYLLQWLPWALSPRITFAYHFYVNIPLVILCNVIVLQRIWNARSTDRQSVIYQRLGVGLYACAVVLAFIYFYPILAGIPIRWNQWWAHMWLGSHWV